METKEENKTTTIQVGRQTWKRLTNLKYKLGCKNHGVLLDKILGIISKFKLEKELEAVK